MLRISRLNRSSVRVGSVAIAARQPIRLLSLWAPSGRICLQLAITKHQIRADDHADRVHLQPLARVDAAHLLYPDVVPHAVFGGVAVLQGIDELPPDSPS
jgi:hypothetical protein